VISFAKKLPLGTLGDFESEEEIRKALSSVTIQDFEDIQTKLALESQLSLP
jgi:hypothetical protein